MKTPKYDIVFQNKKYSSREAAQGPPYILNLIQTLDFKSVLDVGCGPGWSVKLFRELGYPAKGIEPCTYLFADSERLKAKCIYNAKADDIPFLESSFDLVFCTDVLEHIPENEVLPSITEMVRVTKKYLFLTICSRKATFFPQLNLHCTVKPRSWWIEKLTRFDIEEIPYGKDNEYLFKKGA